MECIGSDSPPVTVYVLLRDDCTIAGIKRDPFKPPRGTKNWQVVAYAKAAASPGGDS